MSDTIISNEDIKEFTTLLAADLENGNVDKVVGLFQYNKTLYTTVGEMLKTGSMFVRLGVNMLLEELSVIKPNEVKLALPYLLPLLQDKNPTIRGDATDLIGIIGDIEQIQHLTPLLEDPHPQVVEIVKETINVLAEQGKNKEHKSVNK